MTKKKNSEPQLDFAIVGEPKSGTTALAQFLAQHPDIAISVPKETAFFATDFHEESDAFHGKQLYYLYRTKEDFASIFSHAEDGQMLGEASTSSLYSKVAAQNLFAHNPKMKIIAMFRNPVDMVESLHMQYVNETVEDITDFSEALAAEADRKAGKRIPKRARTPSYLFYNDRVTYADQLKRFYKVFPKEHILILTMEEMKSDNEKTYKKVVEFLGADAKFTPQFGVVHGSKSPRSKLVNTLFNNPQFKRVLNKALGAGTYTKVRNKVSKLIMREQKREKMPESLRQELTERYSKEVGKFEELTKIPARKLWGMQ